MGSILKGDWVVKDLEKDENWFFELDFQDKKEIIKATKHSLETKKDLYNITKSDFPLDILLSKLYIVQKQLDCGLGFVLLRNLPIEYFNDEEAKFMLWGIGQYLGYPEVQDKAGSLLHVVTDTGSSVNKTDNRRGFFISPNFVPSCFSIVATEALI